MLGLGPCAAAWLPLGPGWKAMIVLVSLGIMLPLLLGSAVAGDSIGRLSRKELDARLLDWFDGSDFHSPR